MTLALLFHVFRKGSLNGQELDRECAREVSEHYGDTPFEELATEIIALTRLDWNTTRYSLHKPITLKFAEKVGKILGSIPQGEKIQHRYCFYM